jgi:GNAT superfamily N-acetyltransferase
MGFTDPGVLESLEALTEQYFRDALQDGTFHGWLAVDAAGTVVGGGGVSETLMPPGPFSPTPTRPEILNVYVEPAYRRQGIARQLMEVMIDWCRARGFGSVFLHASDEGRPLYASMGFEPMATNSFTAAADLLSAACSSGVSLISTICSTPFAPSFTGTPTNSPLMPYSPSR